MNCANGRRGCRKAQARGKQAAPGDDLRTGSVLCDLLDQYPDAFRRALFCQGFRIVGQSLSSPSTLRGPGYGLLQRVQQPQNKLLGAVTRIPSRPVKTNQIVHRRFG